MRFTRIVGLATCLALAAALPQVSPESELDKRADGKKNTSKKQSGGGSGGPNDPNDLGLLRKDKITTDKDKVFKPCTDPLATTTGHDPKVVWDELGCDALWNALSANWTSEKDKTDLVFSQYVSFIISCLISSILTDNPQTFGRQNSWPPKLDLSGHRRPSL